MPLLNNQLCTACQACVVICSREAIQIIDEKIVVDQLKCTECGECVDICTRGALKKKE